MSIDYVAAADFSLFLGYEAAYAQIVMLDLGNFAAFL